MRRMRILHEEVVVADDGDLAALAAAMNRGAFAKDIAIADPHLARSAGIRNILRLVANDNIRMNDVPLADFSLAENRDMTDEPRSRADTNLTVEQTERADLDALGELDIGADDGTRMNARGGHSAAQ